VRSVPRREELDDEEPQNLYLNEDIHPHEEQHDMSTQKYYAGGHTTDQQETPSSSKDFLSTRKFPSKYPSSLY
jgi:hypothetical protein